MARKSLLLAGVVVLAAGVPGLVLARAAAAPSAVEVVPPPERTGAVVIATGGEPGRVQVAAGPFPPIPDALYGLRVVIGVSRPSAALSLSLRSREGAVLAECAYRPGGYPVDRPGQSVLLTCPLDDPAALGTVVLQGFSEGGLIIRAGRRSDGVLRAGGLLALQPGGAAAAVDRLSMLRPAAFRAPTLLGALGLSVLLLGAAGLVLAGARPRDQGGRPAPPPLIG